MSQAGRHDSYFRLLSGERRGAGPALLRGLLWAASVLYRGAMVLRRTFYALAAERVELPVVSVGNLTVGGTGKTPLVAFLARRLCEMGHRPLVVSRGYKRTGPGPGDEAAALRRELPADVVHVESPDRIEAIRSVIAREPRDVAILDDGFQHLRLRRDLDIVTLDATRPFGFGHVLPRGLLREPLGALRRAQAVVITRSDQVTAEELARVESRVARRLRRGTLLLHAVHAPLRLSGPGATTVPLEALRGAAVFAFCGLANPAAFYRTLEDLGAHVVARRDFADHHHYSGRDVADIIAAARAAGLGAGIGGIAHLVTTTKDFVKVASDTLIGAWPEGAAPLALEVEMQFREGPTALDPLLKKVVGPNP